MPAMFEFDVQFLIICTIKNKVFGKSSNHVSFWYSFLAMEYKRLCPTCSNTISGVHGLL